jgi:hypothetical protein
MRGASWLAAALVAGLAVGLPGPVLAQPRRSGPAATVTPAERGGDGDGGSGSALGPGRRDRTTERREQIKKKIRALRAYTLTEELRLDELTATRLFPVLSRYDDETDRLLEKRVEVQRRLRRADTMRDARTIDRVIDDAIANQRSFWELEDKRVAELRKILTPSQTAKLLVVLPALERKIQNQLRRAIVQRGNARGTDDDDDPQPDEVPPSRPLRRREAPLAPLAPRGSASNAPGNTAPCSPNTEPCR